MHHPRKLLSVGMICLLATETSHYHREKPADTHQEFHIEPIEQRNQQSLYGIPYATPIQKQSCSSLAALAIWPKYPSVNNNNYQFLGTLML